METKHEPNLEDYGTAIALTGYVAGLTDLGLWEDLMSTPDDRLACVLLLTRRGVPLETVCERLSLPPGTINRLWNEWMPT